jgi:uncharacterized protein
MSGRAGRPHAVPRDAAASGSGRSPRILRPVVTSRPPSDSDGLPPPRPPLRVIPLALGLYAGACAVAVAISAWRGDAVDVLGERAPDARGLALGAGLGVAVVVLSRLADRWSAAMRRFGDALSEALGPLTPAQCLVLALASGVGEELLFRGALQPWLGLAVASLLFGAAHVVRDRALLLYPVIAAAVGAALGWLRLETGSVGPPVLAHVLVNAVNLLWLGGRDRADGRPA